MPNRKTFDPDYDPWEPPSELLDMLHNKKLLQRDRVELVVAFYAESHGGNSPTYEKIGEIMCIPRPNAYRFAMELTMGDHPRAIKRNGKFWLLNSQYSHPLIKERFSEYTASAVQHLS